MSALTGVEIFAGDLEAIRSKFVDDFRGEAARCINSHGHFSVAVPGGSVAVRVLPALASLALDWNRTHVFWVDERAVPRTDPESNCRAASEAWLAPAGAPQTSIHPMPADQMDLARAARAYTSELTRVLGDPPSLDYVILGVGPDGHVASLFSGHAAVEDTVPRAVAVLDAPKPPARRLTLTMPMLTGAGRVVIAALEESKAAAISEAVENESSTLPVALVLRRATRALLLLDERAALRRDRGQ